MAILNWIIKKKTNMFITFLKLSKFSLRLFPFIVKVGAVNLLLFIIGYSCSSTKKVARQDFFDAKYEVVYSVEFIGDTIEMTKGLEDRFVLMIGDNFAHGYSYLEYYKDSLSRTPGGVFTLAQSLLDSYEDGPSFWSSAISTARLFKDYEIKKIKRNR